MTGARRLAAWLVLMTALPAHAQDSGDKARLDDFALPHGALPHGDTVTTVEQLDSDGGSPEFAQQQPGDRAVTIPALGEAPTAPVMQISRPGKGEGAGQLTKRETARGVVASSVSSTADSAPGAVVVLAGKDKCDPQQESGKQEECQTILERRSGEFQAVEAPKLSAEQALLAEQGIEIRRTAGPSQMLQFAARDDPDAAIRSNQELASLYLLPSTGQAESQPAQSDTAGMAEALGELVVSLGGQIQP